MTSPVGGKPSPTQGRYNDVHSRGSSFGAELDEKSVRKLLGNQVESPFASIVIGVANAFGGLITEVADAITGIIPDGARAEPIKDAIIAKMQPLESEVQALGESLTELSTETMTRIEEQKSLVEDANSALETVKSTLAEQAKKNEEFQSELATARSETSDAVKKSSEAVSLANSINATLTKQITSKFNSAIAKAEEGISKAETANSELIQMNTSLGELTAQASELNKQLSAQNEKFTNGLSEANSAIEEAKDATAAVKKVADQNKKDVATAVSKADKASAEVATLTPKVTDAVSKANKASSDVSTLTPKVTAASADAAKASQDVAALSPKVTDAVNKSAKATSDVAALTPKVTAAQSKADSAFTEAGKVRSEVAPKIEAAQTKGQEALSVADKAISWLRNPNEIGTSIIAINPETNRPYYADKLELVDDNPPNTAGPTYMRPETMAGVSTYGPQVAVDPKIKYTVSFWAKASKPGSVLYGQFRNNTGKTVAPDGSPMSFGAVDKATPPQPSNKGEDGKYVHGNIKNSYFINRLELQTEWTYYETEIQFAEGITSVGISVMYWNHTYGERADQYISGLDIRPQIPTQASVDQAQNDAIRANTEILRQQQEINAQQEVFNTFQTQFNKDQVVWNQASSDATQALQDAAKVQETVNKEQKKLNTLQSEFNTKQTTWNNAVDRSLANQKVLNDNVSDWTKGATTAIEANTSAIKALGKIDTGESLIKYLTPTDEEVRAGTAKYDVPVWTTAAHREFSGQNSPPEHVKHAFGASSSEGTKPAKTVPATVRPGTKYILSFWAYGSGKLVIYMYGNGGVYPIRSTRQLKVNQETLRIEKDAGGRRYYDPSKNGNSSNKEGTQWLLNGFKPDELYKWTHYKFEVEFTEPTTEVWFQNFYWNWSEPSVYGQYLADMQFYPDVPTQADVDEAQNKAIQVNKDLLVEQARINAEQERINDLRTEFEEEQKKINTAQADINTLNTETGKANKAATEALSKVLGINIGGRNLLKESLFQKTTSDYLIHRFPLGDSKPQDGEEVTFSIKAKPGEGKTRFVLYNSNGNGASSLFTLYIHEQEPSPDGVYKATGKWRVAGGNSHLNVYAYPSSVDTESEIEWVKLERGNTATDWTPAPEETPSQADLNQSFQDNFERVDKELGLIKSTDQEWKDSQKKVNESLSKAADANTATLKVQEEVNFLIQEQIWSQQDMIDQLDIQRPQVVHVERQTGENVGKRLPNYGWLPSGWGSGDVLRTSTPLIDVYVQEGGSPKYSVYQAKGRWEGVIKHSMNWSNGAVDIWSNEITTGGTRTFNFTGGAFSVNFRNSTYEIYPRNLGRQLVIATEGLPGRTPSGWVMSNLGNHTGYPTIRYQDKEKVRLAHSVKCTNYTVLASRYEKGGWKTKLYNAGEVIPPSFIFLEDLESARDYEFVEANQTVTA